MVSRGKNTPLCVASGAKTCTFVCIALLPRLSAPDGYYIQAVYAYSCAAESLIEKLTHDCRS